MNEYVLKKANSWIKKEVIPKLETSNLPLEAYYKIPFGLSLVNDLKTAKYVWNFMDKQLNVCEYLDRYLLKRRCENYYKYWIFLYCIHTNSKKKYMIYENIKKSFSNLNKGFLATKIPDEYELRSTAFGGICAYLMNDSFVSQATSDFVIDIYMKNIKENTFYFMKDKKNELIKKYPKKLERFYIYDLKVNKPLTYAISLATINLCLGYLMSERLEYLKYAKKYFKMLLTEDNALILNSYAGKLGIALALLYYITRENKYYDYLVETMDYFKQTQKTNGCWKFETEKTDDMIITIDRTSEFLASIRIINSIIQNANFKSQISRCHHSIKISNN